MQNTPVYPLYGQGGSRPGLSQQSMRNSAPTCHRRCNADHMRISQIHIPLGCVMCLLVTCQAYLASAEWVAVLVLQSAKTGSQRSARQLLGARLLRKTCMQLLVAAESPPGASRWRNRPLTPMWAVRKAPGFCVPFLEQRGNQVISSLRQCAGLPVLSILLGQQQWTERRHCSSRLSTTSSISSSCSVTFRGVCTMPAV